MQTFLPFSDIEKNVSSLDNKRLGKQRVEVLQILKALSGETKGWVNHPATVMWRGYENALVFYGVACCSEWEFRGFKDTCTEKILSYLKTDKTKEFPPWFGDDKIHRSHRSNLLRKDFDFYSKKFTDVGSDLPYAWPVNNENGYDIRYKHAGSKGYEN